jgi:uncharacterized protein YkwD
MKNLLTFLLVLLTLSVTSQTDTEQVMVNGINQVRTNPKSYITEVESYITTQELLLEMVASGQVVIKSTRGGSTKDILNDRIESAKELILVLDTLTPMDSLSFNSDMQVFTKLHGEYLKSINSSTHRDVNGGFAADRMKSLNLKSVRENITTDNGNAVLAIIELLVDSGISSRAHRVLLLNPSFTQVSVYTNGKTWIQNFAK